VAAIHCHEASNRPIGALRIILSKKLLDRLVRRIRYGRAGVGRKSQRKKYDR
jgi:hypothetical protein